MKKQKLHEDIKFLSENVYNPYNTKLGNEWQLAKYVPNSKTGFQGAIYKNGNDVVVVYAGTNQLGDFLGSDAQMYAMCTPNQQKEAHELHMEAKRMYPNLNIMVGGHSLGGALAQLESAHTGVPAVTFNAYGTGEILRIEGYTNQKDLNIINYGNPYDVVFGMKYNAQPGRTFITDTNLNSSETYSIGLSGKKQIPDINKHYLSQMGSLENAVEVEPTNLYDIKQQTPMLEASISYDKIFTPNEIGKMSSQEFVQNEQAIMKQLKNGQIKADLSKVDYKTFKNLETGTNKIYTREDISKMSTDDYSENEKEILSQMKSIGIPYKNDLPQGIQTHSDKKESATSSKSKSNNSSGGSADGKWVTINGNHVLIDK